MNQEVVWHWVRVKTGGGGQESSPKLLQFFVKMGGQEKESLKRLEVENNLGAGVQQEKHKANNCIDWPTATALLKGAYSKRVGIAGSVNNQPWGV